MLLAAAWRLLWTRRRGAALRGPTPQAGTVEAPRSWAAARLQDALVLHRSLPDGDRREWLATGRLTPQPGGSADGRDLGLPFLVYQPSPGRETFWSPKQLNALERALILAELRRQRELQLVPPGYQGEIDVRLERGWAAASREERSAMRERAQAAFAAFFNRTWRAKTLGDVLPIEENTHAGGTTPAQAETHRRRPGGAALERAGLNPPAAAACRPESRPRAAHLQTPPAARR